MLIKKKDVNDYFAARKGRRRPGGKQTSVVPPIKSSSVIGAGKRSSPAPSIKGTDTSASTQDLSVPFFTSEPGFMIQPSSVVKSPTKS